MTKTYSIKSPAKINIGLRVLSKRPDGYHNIETIFYPIKIYDEIRVKIRALPSLQPENKISVKSKGIKIPANKGNICYNAAALFLREFRIKEKYRIEITISKNIPVGAGLGGGSSDAAIVLKILGKHFKSNSPAAFKMLKQVQHGNIKKLQCIALHLGSDVPYFLSNKGKTKLKAAYAESRGEKLTSLPEFKIGYKILIVNPGVHVSTKEAYDGLRISEGGLRIKKHLNKTKKFDLEDTKLFENNFEKNVFRKYPEIKGIKEKMYKHGSVFSLMSGSGSTVYGFFKPGKIKTAEKYFRSLNYKVFIS